MKNCKDVLIKAGAQCAEGRKQAGVSLEEIAYELGYAKENLYAFEKGRNNNLVIYLYYKEKGLIQ